VSVQVDEIAPDIYRLCTFVPDVPPAGFTFNQFLVVDDEPLLYHAGPRLAFPEVAAAVERVLGSVEELRWLSFSHVESDESGAMNQFLEAAPHAQVAFNALGCDVSINDLAIRPPTVLHEDEPLELGSKRMRLIETPHVPHNWESQMLFEETSATLFCGDILTQMGNRGALVGDDVLEPAIAAEDVFHQNSLSAHCGATLRRVATLEPDTLAIMHGASYSGPAVDALNELADEYDRRAIRVLEHGLGELPGKGCPEMPGDRPG
jgi:flavorubredoxin